MPRIKRSSSKRRRKTTRHTRSRHKHTYRCRRHTGGVLTSNARLIRQLSNPPAHNVARFLQTMCSKAHFCMTFGRETTRLNNFFDFTSFKYLTSPLTRISSGANGLTTELIYEREGYKASAILKTTINPGSDNLFLEAYNGLKYVNVYNRYFPCFLETYGAFLYKSNYEGNNLKRLLSKNKHVNLPHDFMETQPLTLVMGQTSEYENQPINTYNNNSSPEHIETVFRDFNAAAPVLPHVEPLKKKIAKSCKFSANNAVLMQYVHNPIRFGEWFTANRTNKTAYCVELPQILFQIYSALAQLNTMNLFTHYDLHSFNVLLYEIPDGKYITMTYTGGPYNASDKIQFKTRYIAKIIDYGRCYFPDNTAMYNLVCMEERVCESDYYAPPAPQASLPDPYNRICGNKVGYGFVDLKGDNSHNYYVNRVKINNAHDLRLIVTIASHTNTKFSEAQTLNNILYNTYNSYTIRPTVRPKNNSGVPSKPLTTTAAEFKFAEDGFFIESDLLKIQTVQELYWTLYNYIAGSKVGSKTFWGFGPDDNIYSDLVEYATLTVDLQLNNPAPMQFIISEGNIMPLGSFLPASPKMELPITGATSLRPHTIPLSSVAPAPAPAPAPARPKPLQLSSIPKDNAASNPHVNIDISYEGSNPPKTETKHSGESVWDTWNNMGNISDSYYKTSSYKPIKPVTPVNRRGNVKIVDNEPSTGHISV